MASSFFQDLIGSITDRGRQLIGMDRRSSDTDDLLGLARSLLSRRGEASGVAIASDLLEAYRDADAAERMRFLRALAVDFGPDLSRLDAAIATFSVDRSPDTVSAITAAADPRRREIIRRLNLAPGGTAALVRMREDVLDRLEQAPELKPLDADFTHMFSSWFNRGFLVLRPIDWSTPANILARILAYEAVHTIHSWDDLRSRLEPADRRCYAFFHPQLPDDPLIFVEVALTREIPDAIGPLLDLDREPLPPQTATTAVFYSISNCQRGLKGVSFGNFLIKQVVENLKRELPKLSRFVTLSPVPGFAGWLRDELATPSGLLTGADRRLLAGHDWSKGQPLDDDSEEAVLAAAAAYFLKAKTAGKKPVDPVARFHLGNGARLERLNPGADLSRRGQSQSYGLMVNYLYDLDHIERNHEAFAEKNEVVASSSVRKKLRGESTVRALLAAPSTD